MNLTNRLFKLRVEVDKLHHENEDGNCAVCYVRVLNSTVDKAYDTMYKYVPQPYPCPTKKLIIDSSKED